MILIPVGIGMFFIAAQLVFDRFSWAVLSALGVLFICAVLFATLTVEIRERVLEVKFGPGIISKKFPLVNIEDCKVVKNPWYYGWGIRFISKGWLYNVSGLKAVEIRLKNGKLYRIGTDEPEKLCRVVRQLLKEV
jgi:hypothetical protein